MQTGTQLAAMGLAAEDVVQVAMRINVEAGSIHAWVFLKKNGFRDDEIMNLLRHTPVLRVVR